MADENPYSSPREVSPERDDRQRSRIAASAFFWINFSVALLLACVALVGAVAPQSPFDLLGGVFMLPITIGYAAAEWHAWRHDSLRVLKVLGYLNLGVAGFAVFGLVANVLEPPAPDITPPPDPGFWFWFWFVVIDLSIVSYSLWCGITRLRWAKRSPSPAASG